MPAHRTGAAVDGGVRNLGRRRGRAGTAGRALAEPGDGSLPRHFSGRAGADGAEGRGTCGAGLRPAEPAVRPTSRGPHRAAHHGPRRSEQRLRQRGSVQSDHRLCPAPDGGVQPDLLRRLAGAGDHPRTRACLPSRLHGTAWVPGAEGAGAQLGRLALVSRLRRAGLDQRGHGDLLRVGAHGVRQGKGELPRHGPSYGRAGRQIRGARPSLRTLARLACRSQTLRLRRVVRGPSPGRIRGGARRRARRRPRAAADPLALELGREASVRRQL